MTVQCVTYYGLTLKVGVVSRSSLLHPLMSIGVADISGWGISPRGAGYLFGPDVVQEVSEQEIYQIVVPIFSLSLPLSPSPSLSPSSSTLLITLS